MHFDAVDALKGQRKTLHIEPLITDLKRIGAKVFDVVDDQVVQRTL